MKHFSIIISMYKRYHISVSVTDTKTFTVPSKTNTSSNVIPHFDTLTCMLNILSVAKIDLF